MVGLLCTIAHVLKTWLTMNVNEKHTCLSVILIRPTGEELFEA
jgi:hypothetical protein